MAKDAIYFLIPLGSAAAGAYWVDWTAGAAVTAGLALFVAFFFRDPRRHVPAEAGLIVAPADGRVVRIEREGDHIRISIFLSIFDVHINRSPIAGRIEDIRYRKGRFLAAFNSRASVENEQNTLSIEGEGIRVECSQIAGLVARRIVCRVRPGEVLARGQRFGLIRFGSRTDLLLPARVEIRVRTGDKVRGGSSVIARIRAAEGGKTA